MAGVEWVQGDLADRQALARLVEGTDVVFHAGGTIAGSPEEIQASLVGGTANVLEVIHDRRLVYLSSLVVLDTAASNGPIRSDSPLEPTPQRRGAYTQAKCAAERVVSAAVARGDVVIVRPGLVVVAEDVVMPPAVALRVGPFWLPVGPWDAALPVVEVASVVAGLLDAAEHAPNGTIVHLIDRPPTTRRQLFDRIAAGLPARAILPLGSLALGAALLGMRLSDAAYRLASAGRPHDWLSSD